MTDTPKCPMCQGTRTITLSNPDEGTLTAPCIECCGSPVPPSERVALDFGAARLIAKNYDEAHDDDSATMTEEEAFHHALNAQCAALVQQAVAREREKVGGETAAAAQSRADSLDLEAAEATLSSTFYEDRGNVEALVDALNAQLAARVREAREQAIAEERRHTQTTIDETRAEYAPLVKLVREFQRARSAYLLNDSTEADEDRYERAKDALAFLPLPEAP